MRSLVIFSLILHFCASQEPLGDILPVSNTTLPLPIFNNTLTLPISNNTLTLEVKRAVLVDRYVVHKELATFFEAWQYCQAAGLRLATVTSSAETELLNRALEQAKAPQKMGYFIAGTDLGAFRNWIWISTNKNVRHPLGYTNWHPGQPDNTNNNEHCIEIFYSGGAFWNDYGCDRKRYYVCEASGV